MDWDERAASWLAAAPDLEIAFEEVFAALFSAARLSSGEVVLDIGCGVGATLPVAARAVGPEGHVTGIDIAVALLAAARKRVPPEIELIAADAGAHDFPAGRFDVLLSNYGMMFFHDPAAAFANLRRATRTGGRLAATVWGAPPDNPWFATPRRIVSATVPDLPPPDPDAPGPMRYGDPEGLLSLLVGAGWSPHVETHDLHLLPPGSPERVAAMLMTMNTGSMLQDIELSDGDRSRIEAGLQEMCRGYLVDGQIRVPARVHVVTAEAV